MQEDNTTENRLDLSQNRYTNDVKPIRDAYQDLQTTFFDDLLVLLQQLIQAYKSKDDINASQAETQTDAHIQPFFIKFRQLAQQKLLKLLDNTHQKNEKYIGEQFSNRRNTREQLDLVSYTNLLKANNNEKNKLLQSLNTFLDQMEENAYNTSLVDDIPFCLIRPERFESAFKYLILDDHPLEFILKYVADISAGLLKQDYLGWRKLKQEQKMNIISFLAKHFNKKVTTQSGTIQYPLHTFLTQSMEESCNFLSATIETNDYQLIFYSGLINAIINHIHKKRSKDEKVLIELHKNLINLMLTALDSEIFENHQTNKSFFLYKVLTIPQLTEAKELEELEEIELIDKILTQGYFSAFITAYQQDATNYLEKNLEKILPFTNLANLAQDSFLLCKGFKVEYNENFLYMLFDNLTIHLNLDQQAIFYHTLLMTTNYKEHQSYKIMAHFVGNTLLSHTLMTGIDPSFVLNSEIFNLCIIKAIHNYEEAHPHLLEGVNPYGSITLKHARKLSGSSLIGTLRLADLLNFFLQKEGRWNKNSMKTLLAQAIFNENVTSPIECLLVFQNIFHNCLKNGENISQAGGIFDEIFAEFCTYQSKSNEAMIQVLLDCFEINFNDNDQNLEHTLTDLKNKLIKIINETSNSNRSKFWAFTKRKINPGSQSNHDRPSPNL